MHVDAMSARSERDATYFALTPFTMAFEPKVLGQPGSTCSHSIGPLTRQRGRVTAGGSVDWTRRDGKLTDNGSVGYPGFHQEVASGPPCIPTVDKSALLPALPTAAQWIGAICVCLRGWLCEHVCACVGILLVWCACARACTCACMRVAKGVLTYWKVSLVSREKN